MQALTAAQYDRLRRLADAWERAYLERAKTQSAYNPRLGVDALCFQPQAMPDGEAGLLGALITPLSLSLALVPEATGLDCPDVEARLVLTLPSGRYPFRAVPLDDEDWLWRCELLDDLSDLEAASEGSRLAQRLMAKVMAPAAE